MKKVVKIILISLLVIFNGALLFRIGVTFNKWELKSLEPTDNLRAAYSRNADLSVLTHKIAADLSENNTFCSYALDYAPDAREAQITIRFNKSAYSKAGVPEGGEFEYFLWNADTDAETPGMVVETKDWLMYRYVRVSFPDADFEEGSSYGVVVKASGAAIDDMITHHKDQVWDTRALSSGEKRALGGN